MDRLFRNRLMPSPLSADLLKSKSWYQEASGLDRGLRERTLAHHLSWFETYDSDCDPDFASDIEGLISTVWFS